jgi:alkylation response protein AidB-like acyl-CoA dehydrogenase
MTTEAERTTAQERRYGQERVDSLPFNTPEKSSRYQTERFAGAIGLNWYDCDLTLQRAMQYYLAKNEYVWAEPRLRDLGELMGGPIAERAEITDKNPPQLVKYDRWGHDISEVIIAESARQTKRDLVERGFMGPSFRRECEAAGVPHGPLLMANGYLLNQAEIGMSCSMGADAGMVEAQVARFAPPDVQEYVLSRIESGEWVGATGQFFTERTGGSDLGGLETTATQQGDAWLLNGFKWFSSNLDGEAFVVLAKPAGAADGVKGIAPFLVLKYRRDGSRNGMRIRQLKAKLGTHAVASGEVEFVDAEAFMLSGPSTDANGNIQSDGRGLARLMSMTNVARLGVALMGLGCARRALVESLCYAKARNSWRTALIRHPLMKRKLVEMIVDVEAVQALLFEGYGFANNQRSTRDLERHRIVPALAKLKAARLGITTASDAIEVHGGNGYIESWPVARILRDAQINTLWEGPDNILCLDVRRAMVRENADEPLIARIREAVENAGEAVPAARLVSKRTDDLVAAIDAWKGLDAEVAEARLFPLTQFMAETFTAAVLCERADWELREFGDDRKSLIASLYAERYLADPDALRGIGARSNPALDRFEEIISGTLVDERPGRVGFA